MVLKTTRYLICNRSQCILPWNILSLNYFSFIYSTQHCLELKYVAAGKASFLLLIFSAKRFHIFHRKVSFLFQKFFGFILITAVRRKMYLWGEKYAKIYKRHVYFSRNLLLCCISLDASFYGCDLAQTFMQAIKVGDNCEAGRIENLLWQKTSVAISTIFK